MTCSPSLLVNGPNSWSVHRRLCPEAFGGLVHNVPTGVASSPIDSAAMHAVFQKYGSYLLPQPIRKAHSCTPPTVPGMPS
jgi:hypothetical protein